jgi:hypothetical protein
MNTKVLYILSAQRSGSTILGRLTDALPDFAFGGEMRRLWQRGFGDDVRCGCGLPHDTCPVWSVAAPAALAGATPQQARTWQVAAAPDRNSALRLARLAVGRAKRPDAATSEYAALLGRTYREFAAASGARVVVDGSKQPADAYVAAMSGADVYVVHLVRDPRGVAYSLTRRAANPAGMHARESVKAAALWTGRNLAAWAIRRAVTPDRMFVLRYEELMADPTAALLRIGAFVGEAVAPPPIENGEITLPTAHTATNQGRSQAQTTVLTPDRSWVTALGAGDFVITTALTSPMRWRFGYRGRHE